MTDLAAEMRRRAEMRRDGTVSLRASTDWPALLTALATKVVLGAMAGAIFGPQPINSALIVGASAPLLLVHLIKQPYNADRIRTSEQENRIRADAEVLGASRLAQDQPAPRRVSEEVAEILDARQQALIGQLTTVSPHAEDSDSA
jgi:hypothetical protein